MNCAPPRPTRRTAQCLVTLYLDLDRVPRDRPLPPALVDRCAWWLPWLHRRRHSPWTTLRSALLARLLDRSVHPATLGDRGAPLWGALHVIDFRRCGPMETARRCHEQSGATNGSAARAPSVEARSQATRGSDQAKSGAPPTWQVQCW